MPKTPGLPFATILTACSLWSTINSARAQDDFLSLGDLKNSLTIAIAEAVKAADQEPYFLVKEVALELQGKTSTDYGGGFAIPIFSSAVDLSAKITSQDSERLAVRLLPATNTVVGGVPTIQLARVIQSIKEAFQESSKSATPSGFQIPEIKYELQWTLQKDATGAINFVIAKLSGGISSEKVQRAEFTLCQTVNLVDCVGG